MDLVSSVCSKYVFPFAPLDYQHDEVNRLAEGCIEHAGYYWGMGAGKTFGTTIHAMAYHEQTGAQIILICPPILLHQWSRWLTRCGISNKIYSGSPKERSEIQFDRNTRYFIMSVHVLKRDKTRIMTEMLKRPLMVVIDEATSIKNVHSANFRSVFQLQLNKASIPATGTPLSTPADAYAYIKLVSPGLYADEVQFKRIHVGSYDAYDRPESWKRLDLLKDNLSLRSSFISTAEVNPDMPRHRLSDVEYKLDKHHQTLYKELVTKQLLVYENGATIDATTPQKLYQAVQQIVLNYGHFANDCSLQAAGFELLDEYLTEIQTGEKLLVFATYNRSIDTIMTHLRDKGIDAVQVNGQVSAKVKETNVERFKNDPKCKVIVMNPESGGYGVDGLQLVCNRMLFMETPTMPRTFWQAVARLERPGQRFVTDVRVATALGTVQVHLRNQLSENNELLKQVIPKMPDLRKQLLGA